VSDVTENNIIANDAIESVAITKEMQDAYLEYAMSVIVSRALPDVRDGLKPVHRRILYAMKESGIVYNKAYKKSARTVGDVLGKYHPHGDAAVYHAMVRLAQDFSMRVPLVDGQGNFGSIDGDSPAAMRYTEARLAKVSTTLLEDLEKDTVEWGLNFDESLKEPEVLPVKFPQLLVNGTGGIAVGMATNIPSHNLCEVCDATVALMENPNITDDELIEIIPGPDFPTGGEILGRRGAHSAYTTGKGSVIMRGKTHFEEIGGHNAIVITEIPYQVNKTVLIEKIAELVKDKKIEGISTFRDESDREGIRMVIELKRDVVQEVVLAQLFKYTPLQSSFGVNMLAINGGRPEQMNLREILTAFINFRKEVIHRRTAFDLRKSRHRAHNVVGLSIAVANIDEVIKLIRAAKDPVIAKDQLMERSWDASSVEALIKLVDDPKSQIIDGKYKLSDQQAKAILDLQLHRLTGLEQDKLSDEIKEIGERIKEYLEILGSNEKIMEIVKGDLNEVKENFGTPRKTVISENEFEHDIEDLIAREEMVVTVTNTGYIKRVPLSTYRAQRRGGKGRNAMNTKEDDFVTTVFAANTHTPLIFFSDRGMAYKMKTYKLPMGSPTSLGKAMINVLPLEQGETITAMMPLPEDEATWNDLFIMFATSRGTVRRNRLSDFTNVRANGKIAMKLEEGDKLVNVHVCDEEQDILLTLRDGKCIRFPVTAIRIFAGRNSVGVRGVKLSDGDEVISMSVINHVGAETEAKAAYLKKSKALRRVEGEDAGEEEVIETTVELTDEQFKEMEGKEQFILSVTDTGFGKRTSSYEYRVTNRGGSGIANIKLGDKSNTVVGSFPIDDMQQLLLVTDQGKLIRIPITNIRVAGRTTMGVTLFKVDKDEKVVSVAVVDKEDEDAEQDNRPLDENGNPIETPTTEGEATTETVETEEVAVEPTVEEVTEEVSEEAEPESKKDEDDLFGGL